MKYKSLAAAVLPLVGLLASNHVSATNLFDPTVSNTTVIDGSSVELNGTLNDTNGNSQPWTVEVYAGLNECVRLFVTSTAFDSELTVVAPNGTVYRDDDSGGSLRPLVKIAGAPVQGWYTVQVGQFAGAPVNSNFTLLYGRYAAGNVNCNVGTPPTLAASARTSAKNPALIAPPAPKQPDAP